MVLQTDRGISSRCRLQAERACQPTSPVLFCRAAVALGCLQRLVRVLTTESWDAAASAAKGNQTVLATVAREMAAVFQEVGPTTSELQGGLLEAHRAVPVPSWPGLLRLLLARPSLLEALDALQQVSCKQLGGAALRRRPAACALQAWRTLQNTAEAWRQGLRWPPVVASAANFATEGDRELAEWGAASGTVACRAGAGSQTTASSKSSKLHYWVVDRAYLQFVAVHVVRSTWYAAGMLERHRVFTTIYETIELLWQPLARVGFVALRSCMVIAYKSPSPEGADSRVDKVGRIYPNQRGELQPYPCYCCP